MGMIALFRHITRPFIGVQTTERDAYARPIGVGTVSVSGLGGANNFRSLSPISQAGINLAFVTPAAMTGIGNSFNTNPELQPLNNSQSTQF